MGHLTLLELSPRILLKTWHNRFVNCSFVRSNRWTPAFRGALYYITTSVGGTQLSKSFVSKWQETSSARSVPQSFPVIDDANGLTYKKNQSRRRRALTGREAADAKEAEDRRRRWAKSIEGHRRARHDAIATQETSKAPIIADESEFSQQHFGPDFYADGILTSPQKTDGDEGNVCLGKGTI